MKPKQIITILLLAFVGVSIGVLVIKQVAWGPWGSGDSPTEMGADVAALPHQVIVYYFHNDIRCVTCLKIETYALEAIESGFAGELEDNFLVWRQVNKDLPENEHFVEDYQLVTSSVIVVNSKDGKHTEWKELSKTWEPDLLADKAAFMRYVQDEIQAYLEGD
jgi:hypothetical protein